MRTIDISSISSLGAELSNFNEYRFVFDNMECNSMEGFLQSLKEEDPEEQKKICLMTGRQAKAAGKKRKAWAEKGVLWWNGEPYSRRSKEYQHLLDRAYETLAQSCPDFIEALLETRDAELTHSMGKSNPDETVLTEKEFVSRLMSLRDRYEVILTETGFISRLKG